MKGPIVAKVLRGLMVAKGLVLWGFQHGRQLQVYTHSCPGTPTVLAIRFEPLAIVAPVSPRCHQLFYVATTL